VLQPNGCTVVSKCASSLAEKNLCLLALSPFYVENIHASDCRQHRLSWMQTHSWAEEQSRFISSNVSFVFISSSVSLISCSCDKITVANPPAYITKILSYIDGASRDVSQLYASGLPMSSGFVFLLIKVFAFVLCDNLMQIVGTRLLEHHRRLLRLKQSNLLMTHCFTGFYITNIMFLTPYYLPKLTIVMT